MKALVLFALATAFTGCATKSQRFNETATLPASAYQQLAAEAADTISGTFPANKTRLEFVGKYDDKILALSLDQALRLKGFKIAQSDLPEEATWAPIVRREHPCVKERLSRFDQRVTLCEDVDPNVYQVSYTVDLEGPGCYYFSLLIGARWQYARLYKMSPAGVLEPFSSPAIKDNNTDHVHF